MTDVEVIGLEVQVTLHHIDCGPISPCKGCVSKRVGIALHVLLIQKNHKLLHNYFQVWASSWFPHQMVETKPYEEDANLGWGRGEQAGPGRWHPLTLHPSLECLQHSHHPHVEPVAHNLSSNWFPVTFVVLLASSSRIPSQHPHCPGHTWCICQDDVSRDWHLIDEALQ